MLLSTHTAIFTVQETHFNRKGKLKVENFEIFEAIRTKQKGGTIIGVHKALSPILIKEYSEEFELLCVEVKIKKKEIRIISGYGPQETWSEAERLPFFLALEEEIIKAELDGKSVIIEMDSNSKLGPELIPNDPHRQSTNGKILSGILQRHGLVVANGNVKCEGKITRRRITKDGVEESIIDHVIISEDLEKDMESIRIDEDGEHVLTKICKTKKGVKVTKSDHNVIISKFRINWTRKAKSARIDMFNLKNKECQLKFTELTSSGDFLSSAFNSEDDINTCTNRFLKRLNQ